LRDTRGRTPSTTSRRRCFARRYSSAHRIVGAVPQRHRPVERRPPLPSPFIARRRDLGLAARPVRGVARKSHLQCVLCPPRYTLTVDDPKNGFGLIVFLVVALVGGLLLASARAAAAEAKRRAAETEVLL